jgi:hypothetical protein
MKFQTQFIEEGFTVHMLGLIITTKFCFECGSQYLFLFSNDLPFIYLLTNSYFKSKINRVENQG